MKKILTVSVLAMMAVTAANAEIASKAYVIQEDNAVKNIIGALSGLNDGITNTSVVAAINSVASSAGSDLTTALADYTKTEDLGTAAFAATTDFDAAGAATEAVNGITVSASNGVSGSAANGVITVAGTAATTNAAGVVQLADSTAVTQGTAGRVVDAAQLKAVADAASNAVDGLGTMAQEAAADYTKTADLDSSTTATTGQVVTAISMADGVLSQTTADPLTNAAYSLQAVGGEAGKYALTAVYDGNTLTGYSWELIQRAE